MKIQELITQYNDKIDLLEQELADMKHKRDVLQEALEMINEGTISGGETSNHNNITVISNKYSNMYWPKAILMALKDNGEMTADQLLENLLKNGFQSTSKSMKSDIYGRLNTLVEKGEIIARKKGKELKRYRIKQDEIENLRL